MGLERQTSVFRLCELGTKMRLGYLDAMRNLCCYLNNLAIPRERESEIHIR